MAVRRSSKPSAAAVEEGASDNRVMAALHGLQNFANEMQKFGVPERYQRSIVMLSWATARKGAPVEEKEIGVTDFLAAEEAALVEVGSVVVAAAIEAEAMRSKPDGAPKGQQWKRLKFRIEACSRAAASAGAAPERCAALQRFGLALLEPYRADLGGPPSGVPPGPGAGQRRRSSNPSAAAGREGPLQPPSGAARLWVLPREGAAWHGPVTAREVLRLAEAGQLGFEALICGLSGPVLDGPSRESAVPLGQSFPALGAEARKDGERAVKQSSD